MDLHRLAEERSVAYHRAIAARLQREVEVLEGARRRVQGSSSTSSARPQCLAIESAFHDAAGS